MTPHDIAAAVCTPKEIEAWDLITNRGYTLRRAAHLLGISHTSVRDRVDNANRKINNYSRSTFPAAPTTAKPPATTTPFRMVIGLLIQRDGPNCYLCQQPVHPHHARVEHIIPTSQGGTDDPTNLALACDGCNTTKGAKYVSILVMSGRPVYHPT